MKQKRRKQVLRPCECFWPTWAVESDYHPVAFDDQLCEFHLQTADGIAIMRFCPWCGGAFPDSKRDSFFTKPSNEEIAELDRLKDSITNVDKMREILGHPDQTSSEFPDEMPYVRQYTYSTKWDTVKLCIQEARDGRLTFIRGGKRKGN